MPPPRILKHFFAPVTIYTFVSQLPPKKTIAKTAGPPEKLDPCRCPFMVGGPRFWDLDGDGLSGFLVAGRHSHAAVHDRQRPTFNDNQAP